MGRVLAGGRLGYDIPCLTLHGQLDRLDWNVSCHTTPGDFNHHQMLNFNLKDKIYTF